MTTINGDGEEVELVVRHSLGSRIFGVGMAGISAFMLFFYWKSDPTKGLQAIGYSAFLISLLSVGLSLIVTRIRVTRMAIVERRLFRWRSISLPEGLSVQKIGQLVVLQDSKLDVLYRFDPYLNARGQLERELIRLLRTETESSETP